MHIKSLQELIGFLSVLKEGQEGDPAVSEYQRKLNDDKKSYNIRKETSDSKQTDEAEEEEYEAEEEIEYEEEEPTSKSSTITPSLDSLIRNINDLRSGESLKRAEIRNEVGEYFDSLSEEEQSVLVLFLRELAAVVTKTKQGSEAQDPSEEPEKIIIKKTEKVQSSDSEPAEKPKKSKAPQNTDVEDDTAPIKVNEQQDLSKIKIKFNLLRD